MLDVLATVLKAQKHKAQGSAAFPENIILSAALTASSDVLKLEKVAVQNKGNRLKNDLSSRQSNESTAYVAELRRTYDAYVGVLKEKLRESEGRTDGLHARVYLQSNSRKKEIKTLKKGSAVLRTDITRLTAETYSEV